jgi:UDP-perosamine 4-acetyltransferase
MRVIGLGAGGHASVVIDILQSAGGFELVGLLDVHPASLGATLLGVPVLGDDEILPELRAQGVSHAFIGVGSVGDTTPRRQLYEKLCQQDFELVNAAPAAVVARSADGAGGNHYAGCGAQSRCAAGRMWLSTQAVSSNTTARSRSRSLAQKGLGFSEIEVGAHIGIGATILQNIHIGRKRLSARVQWLSEMFPERAVMVGIPACSEKG